MEIRHFMINCIAYIFLGMFLMILSVRRFSLKKTAEILLGSVIILIGAETAVFRWEHNKIVFF